MGRVQIHGGEYPVSKIFSDDFVFRIPLYQRPYSWQREHAEALLDDLLGFIGDGDEPIEDLNPYFLGSIVLIKEDHRADAEVVDGQQRLTTLTILLSVIRSTVTGDAAKALTGYIYERGNPIEGTADRFRLTLRDRDAEFFREYVQREGQIEKLRTLNAAKLVDSQKNVHANAVALLNRLSKLPEPTRLRLVQFIVRNCLLVVVSTPDFDSAYRIFSILNTRGLDLSHADILKSELIGSIPASEQDVYVRRWEDVEEGLGREAFGDLFQHVRTIYRKVKARDTILKEFREQVIAVVGNSKKLIDDVLVPFGDAFRAIRESSYVSASGADAVNEMLRWLNRLDNADWVPPAILFLRRHEEHPDKLRRFFTDLERLAAVMMMRRVWINPRIERYGKLLSAIEQDADLFADDSPLQVTDEEKVEALTALSGAVYQQVPPVRTYILLRLDSFLSGGGATYDHELLTVEHVLPQNPQPGSEWESWWPDASARADAVHRLGNLVLLTRKKNSSASNFEFEKKKTAYFMKGGVSPFPLTTQVLNESEWTPEVFKRRQAVLLGAVSKAWRLWPSPEFVQSLNESVSTTAAGA